MGSGHLHPVPACLIPCPVVLQNICVTVHVGDDVIDSDSDDDGEMFANIKSLSHPEGQFT